MPDTKALKELLPEIEKQEGQWPDELLGRFLCALKNAPFGRVEHVVGMDAILIWTNEEPERFVVGFSEDGCPDTDLTAADKLCGELGYERTSGHSGREGYAKSALVVNTRNGHSKMTWHPTSEPTAICLALGRALVAEGEG